MPAARPGTDPSGGITDLNAGSDLHLADAPGQPRDAGRAIVDALYPPGALCRIPTVALTGGGPTTARFVAHLLAEGGRRIGLAGTDGVHIAGRQVESSDDSGPRATQLVLGDPTVDVAVLEIDRTGLLEGGLGYDRTDVAVVTNPDAAGPTRPPAPPPAPDSRTAVESVVTARVRDGGTLVLDADHPRATELLEQATAPGDRVRVVLFDRDPANPVIRAHLHAGGCAYVLESGWLTQLRDCYKVRLLPVAEVPATAEGQDAVAYALAAVAAAAAHGLSPATIRRRMQAFDISEPFTDPGNVARIGVTPAIRTTPTPVPATATAPHPRPAAKRPEAKILATSRTLGCQVAWEAPVSVKLALGLSVESVVFLGRERARGWESACSSRSSRAGSLTPTGCGRRCNGGARRSPRRWTAGSGRQPA